MLQTLDPPYAQEALELGLNALAVVSGFVLFVFAPVIVGAFVFGVAMLVDLK